MTEQEIRNLQPGPDMDILLEVELFGKVRGGVGRLGLVGDGRYYSYPRQLSRTWEGMGLVVEELRKHYRVDLLLEKDTNYCSITDYDDTIEAGSDISAPHAVAMAALLALLALRGGASG
ncbi:hypothetical protein [Paenibacillus ehimensis]|uniref:Phage ABA sandwich domain-containing protein n=1 Tax=Paenibacillus ehimensis TaxID=79264 RepID=A0ABT8VML2_9BACL|nr:hypothetical protein [Paenibacillus ehimensis]MDO3682227.1 hypothetical protein [Paenibacillus ehimensis]